MGHDEVIEDHRAAWPCRQKSLGSPVSDAKRRSEGGEAVHRNRSESLASEGISNAFLATFYRHYLGHVWETLGEQILRRPWEAFKPLKRIKDYYFSLKHIESYHFHLKTPKTFSVAICLRFGRI